MRALILAQGDGRRWERPDGSLPLGVPKHLIPIDGEPLLARTSRLLRERGVTDVVVIGPDDPRYRVAQLVSSPDPHPTGTSMDKLFASQPWWSPDDRTTILWGDCFYSEATISAVVACQAPDPHWFRRTGPSEVTGHKWDESFAITFLPEHHQRLLEVAGQVNEMLPAKRIHMWNHYAAMIGRGVFDVKGVIDAPHQTPVDDWTDDFDSWSEFCGWTGRYYAPSGPGSVPMVVAVPWTDRGCEHRRAAWEWCRVRLESIGATVVSGGGGSRSAQRNEIVGKAFAEGAESILMTDADTFVTPEQMWASAYAASIADSLVVGYVDHVRLDRAATARLLAADPMYKPRRPRRGRKHSTGGAVAVRRHLWDAVGGYDERFVSWGSEDRAFEYAAVTMGGPLERVDGLSWHLWHPKDETAAQGDEGRQANEALALRYKAAAGMEPVAGSRRIVGEPDREAMAAILAEPGGPLA